MKRNASLIILGLFAVVAVAGLLVLAQRLMVEAYWETHPEARLKAEVQRPAIEKALATLRAKRDKSSTRDTVDLWMSQTNPAEAKAQSKN